MPTDYTLAPAELDAARAALQKAVETFRVTKTEERLSKALRVCLRVTAGAFAFVVIVMIIDAVVFSEADAESFARSAVPIVGGLAVFTIVLGAALVLVLSALNWRVILNAFRQRRLLKRLGLEEVSHDAWKAKHRLRLVDRLRQRATAVILGAALLIVAILMMLATGWFEVVAQGLALLVVLTYPVWGFVERMRQQMKLALDAQRVLGALDRTEASETGTVVPAAVLERAARIEHAQIAAERAHAIAAGAVASRGYALLTTRDVTAQKAALPPTQRLELEELIEEVVEKPTAWPAGVEAGGSIRRARTADGAIEIDYEIDEPAKTIRVIGCRGIGAPAVGV